MEPRARRSENLAGIDAYGYASAAQGGAKAPRKPIVSIDEVATSVGDFVARRIVNFRESEIAARADLGRLLPDRRAPFPRLPGPGGDHPADPRRLAADPQRGGAGDDRALRGRRVRSRLGRSELLRAPQGRAPPAWRSTKALPALIDLLVVTLEAGVAFSGALKMAAERLTGPLGDEIRLTIQEQALGLSMLEALENWLKRCDTPNVRSFVRAMVQGDRLGVSIGTILRNQAVEMRARQRAVVTERAQKAPIKILFPLVFLIFPAMFLIILGPAMFQISKSLKG